MLGTEQDPRNIRLEAHNASRLRGTRARTLALVPCRVMSAAHRFWEEIEAIFDPEVPVEDPVLFAERDPTYNPLVTLERVLQRQSRVNRRYLLAGTVGNGKTSELYHFGDKLSQHRMIVRLDLWRHFQASLGDPAALSRLEPWELLGLLGLAIYRAGADRFGHIWRDEHKALERALEELRTDKGDGPSIDIPKLARGMVIAAGGVVGTLAGGPLGAIAGSQVSTTALSVLDTASESTSWAWKLGSGDRRRDDQDVKHVLVAVNRMLSALHTSYQRRLLLLVDGLDRAGQERIRSLFVESALLGELACDAVWIAPGGIRRLDHEIRGFEIQELCNVPVLNRDDPSRYGKGLEFFRSLVAKRVAQVRQIVREAPSDPFPQEMVDRLAYYSGGLSRDFVRMIRMAAGEALDGETEALTPAIVEFTLREARRLKEAQMNSEEIELLERLMIDNDHKLPPGDVAATLLAQQRLLAYPNKTTWYFPHPLLTLALLKP